MVYPFKHIDGDVSLCHNKVVVLRDGLRWGNRGNISVGGEGMSSDD